MIFFALIALRMFSTQRRGRSRVSAPGRSFVHTAPTDPAADTDTGAGNSGQMGSTGIAPGWLTDPTGRHEKRYWSGSAWTEHVNDAGVPGTDPPPGSADRSPPS
ncbi:MAG TPA: DUF2510 domain-containing protein [Acidimicrobiales bacterium]|nr:DUF2510 domain-containing protein [Acidimicrobiales bacterium]